MSVVRYPFSDALCGFFELPIEDARALLPAGGRLEPVELRHGVGVFFVTIFDFDESPVGPYGEVVMSVLVAPHVVPGKRLPHAALHVYRLATTTPEAREHSISRWHLPNWKDDVQIELDRGEQRISGRVGLDGAPVLELTVHARSFEPVSQLYQSFIAHEGVMHQADLIMEGEQSEHEDERGRLVLHDHPLTRELASSDARDVPFRELWMRRGVELFHPLVPLRPLR